MSILIRNGRALLPDGSCEPLSVAVRGNRIERIAPEIDSSAYDTVIDAADQLVMPGLVNAHTHLAMVLFRGYADDMPLQPWLEEAIWPAEAKLTAEHVYWGSLWGCIELIRGGVTAFCDMYFQMDQVARAVEEAGIRALLT
jgi:5-methylthioadenosine/S-adenosylhomocysteine deaminase